MSNPLGQTPRIWATEGDSVPTMPSGPSGRSAIIRVAAGDSVPTMPAGPSGRSQIIRIPGGTEPPLSICPYDIFDRTVSNGWGDWTHG